MRMLSAVLVFALLYAASASVYTTGNFYGHKGKVATRHPVVLGKYHVFLILVCFVCFIYFDQTRPENPFDQTISC